MGREISLFSDYRQKENSLTNYCGLILKLLYSENPASFEETITSMVSGDVDLMVGPTFAQQHKEVKSIPDLSISQKAFSIFFETKLTDWFYSSQIKRHIDGLSSENGTKILFLISNFQTEEYEERFSKDRAVAQESGIILQAISFEEFMKCLKGARSSDVFKSHLEEFENYLDRSGRLPRWKKLLEVVNCRGTLHEVKNGAYMCPDKGGAYRHRRAKFFGPYANKNVSKIYEIDAVVSVDVNMSNVKLKWKNKDISNKKLEEIAIGHISASAHRTAENEKTPLQVFILSNGSETNFRKVSSGGMFQSKKYFYGLVGECTNSRDLANKLNGESWE
ncbi:MAG: hypothetical protein AB7D06_08530 [Pedobacter sp.]